MLLLLLLGLFSPYSKEICKRRFEVHNLENSSCIFPCGHTCTVSCMDLDNICVTVTLCGRSWVCPVVCSQQSWTPEALRVCPMALPSPWVLLSHLDVPSLNAPSPASLGQPLEMQKCLAQGFHLCTSSPAGGRRGQREMGIGVVGRERITESFKGVFRGSGHNLTLVQPLCCHEIQYGGRQAAGFGDSEVWQN